MNAAIIEQNRCGWIVAPGGVDDFLEVLSSLEGRAHELDERKRNSRKVGERLGSRANSVTMVEWVRAQLTPQA